MKILFFAPHSAIWVHAFPEALVAESLAQHGHEIVYVTCHRQFAELCIPMAGLSLSLTAPNAAKSKICDACEKSAQLIVKRFGFRNRRIGDCLTQIDRETISGIVSGVTRRNFLELRLHGVDVGRLALYELLLNHKKHSLDFSDTEWAEYLVYVKNALLSLFANRALLDEESPDRVVVYNSLYSVNSVACRLAENREIPTYFLHAGGSLSHKYETMLMGRRDGFRFYEELLDFWHRVKHLPCGRDLLAPVTDHYLELLRGQSGFVYSTPRSSGDEDLRKRLGIPTNSRVLVATMSSPDERFAAESIGVIQAGANRTFADQIEWIRTLCEWISGRADLFLIVRVHPREFPNRREGVTSEHARTLLRVLAEVPANVVVNWPSDGVSLYDLADVADVFLNGWSAAGKEMSLLGVPVVAYARELLVYPPDLNLIGESRDDYFSKVVEALRSGWSIERVRMTYRWYALEYERAAIGLRESFPGNAEEDRGFARSVVRRILNRADPQILRAMDCRNRAPSLLASDTVTAVIESGADSLLTKVDFEQTAVSLEDETIALRHEVRRLLGGLRRGAKSGPEGRLCGRLLAFSNGSSA